MNCIFCDINKSRIVLENEKGYAIFDGFPVSKGHMLIIPKRHIETYFEAAEYEKKYCGV